MPVIEIDGRDYRVGEHRNCLQAALDHGLDLPYFCWHPAMGSVGSCRLCAVVQYADEDDDTGRVVMSCMTPASDGTRIAIDEPRAREVRRSVIEWLMIHHPHDCPVCDEGGECHLQDMTVMTGHAHRRRRGRKRTYRNQYLGPLIHHDMNRCIQCYRCVRFYKDYADGDDLGVFGHKDRVYFGRAEDGVLELPFAGNLVEVCPTGVFTDKTLRAHYARKWDLQTAPSICTHCGLGCNTLPGALDGTLRRVTTRYNGEVNGYWLCDRGRFGYEHANDDGRLRRALARDDERGDREGGPAGFTPLGWEATLERVQRSVREAARDGRLAAVGSPRASLETNFVLQRLATPERFSVGVADAEMTLVRGVVAALRRGPMRTPTLQEISSADAALVLGTDPTHEAPLVDLALVRACRTGSARLTLVGPRRGRLDDIAERALHLDPAVAARFGLAVAAELAGAAGPAGLPEGLPEELPGALDETLAEAAGETAAALAAAERPLVVTGTWHRSPALLEAALRVTLALADAVEDPVLPWFALAGGEANTMGLAMLDDGAGLGLDSLVEAIEAGDVDTLIVCDNDLFSRLADGRRLAAALDRLETLIVLDQALTPTGERARWLLPSATPEEYSGTWINSEGRAQRAYQVTLPGGDARPPWSVLRDLLAECAHGGPARGWRNYEAVTRAVAERRPELRPIVEVAPPAAYRSASRQRIPRLSHRFSGRNARPALLPTARDHPRPPEDEETPLAFSMEGFDGEPPAALLTRAWSPGWNSNEAINKLQIEVGGPLHGGDPGRRLLEPPAQPELRPAELDLGAPPAAIPSGSTDGQALEPAGPRLRLCALPEIFGSDGRARRSPAVGELAPAPYLLLHPATAAELGVVADGDDGARRRVVFSTAEAAGSGGQSWEAMLVVRTDDSLPTTVAAVPAGYAETAWWQAPLTVRLAVDDGDGGDS